MWCGDDPTKDDIGKQRIKCGTLNDLTNQGCSNIITKNSTENLENRVSAEISGDILIKPQKLDLSLRYGDPLKFKLLFQSPQHYPIDMYYLMDLSQSMKVSIQYIYIQKIMSSQFPL